MFCRKELNEWMTKNRIEIEKNPQPDNSNCFWVTNRLFYCLSIDLLVCLRRSCRQFVLVYVQTQTLQRQKVPRDRGVEYINMRNIENKVL